MITIRTFQPGDETDLRAIFFHTIRNINTSDYSQAQVTAWAPKEYDKSAWVKKIVTIKPFVAIVNNQIVGYADIQEDGYIDHFFCHWQRHW